MMEENLDKALSAVLGEEISPKEMPPSPVLKTPGTSSPGARALEHYNKARAYLREGNWAGYGKELEELEKILNEMTGTE